MDTLTVAVDSAVKALGLRQYVQPRLQGLHNAGEPMSRDTPCCSDISLMSRRTSESLFPKSTSASARAISVSVRAIVTAGRDEPVAHIERWPEAR